MVALGEIGRSPELALSAPAATSTAPIATATTGHTRYTSVRRRRRGIKRGYVHGESDATGSSPKSESPVHPNRVPGLHLSRLHGIDPDTIVYNHLNQPRELVKAKPVTAVFA